MDKKDVLADLLEELGRSAGQDPIRALEEHLRAEPRHSGRVLDRLLPALASAPDERSAGTLAVACGAAHLAKSEAKNAREMLTQGLALLGETAPALSARASVRLGRLEAEAGERAAARARLARALPAVLDAGDEALAADLESAFVAAREDLVAEVLSRLRRERRAGARGAPDKRLEVVSRLAHALNSSLASTSEPLYAILRAILDETGAERGFVMLYEGSNLRFELGLARDGRALGPQDFAFSTTVVEKALAAGEAVLIPDLEKALAFAQASSARDMGLRAALATPLRVDRKRPGAVRTPGALTSLRGIAGVLYVDSTSAGSFGADDARFLETLADCAVLAIRAARAAVVPAAPAAPAPRVPAKGSSKRSPEEPARPGVAPVHGVVTQDPVLLEVLRKLERAAESGTSVLLRGESGTGKELLARALHSLGARNPGPFVVLDCGAIPDELAPVELFGHEAHAFTGAAQARAGLLERASGGTLFLDEVGEMSLQLQASLLRALQEGEVRRVGGSEARPVHARIVSATHRDLGALVERGAFRHDLLYRLAVVELRIPPLRDRPADIAPLVEHLLVKIGQGRKEKLSIEPEAVARLEEHGWPGNVRELENVLNAASLAATSGGISVGDVDLVLSSSTPSLASVPGRAARAAPAGAALDGTLEEIERRVLAERLERMGWNQVQAAASLGVDRNTLRRKILRYGIARGK